ncbi:ATP-grasp domain-containing protein [Campylobacter troglodytis]|uniref:ATP-grasp domain-containing protein n=1 Tax=Campylobacter troglodytis TaxID=654363 RepID=UPI00115A77CA|nr:alpha-L-glutamate ligase [Campylobacter troglodytis]TQR57294.1 alpha-L-glutamate ligase [Campylobacter troglodytis]
MLYNDLQNGIYIMHENEEWIPPFKEAFERAGVEFFELDLSKGGINLDKEPPKGVFWSRMSASSHTRAHPFAKEYARAIFAWLQSFNRRIVNPLCVLELEVSKVAQYLALNKAGFRTPKTLVAFGKADLLELAKSLQAPFIIKHNQGGKGLGVKLYESFDEFKAELDGFEESIDGIYLAQEYVKSQAPFITRLEFIGGKFHYAVRVDTSDGGFELCPAEACELERKPQLAAAACDIGAKFTVREDINAEFPFVKELEAFLKHKKIEIAGVEFIESVENELVVYDINTNTNYNKALEDGLRAKGLQGAADRVVEFLHTEFKKERV